MEAREFIVSSGYKEVLNEKPVNPNIDQNKGYANFSEFEKPKCFSSACFRLLTDDYITGRSDN